MKEGPDIAQIAALIGDPARANMLTALMSGKALTVGELAREAGITVQTASTHLSKLDAGGLACAQRHGRHKYVSLANDDVAHVLEGLMGLAAGSGHLRTRTGPKDAQLRQARVCYNHLAGDRGTQMFDSLVGQGHLVLEGETLALTPSGAEFTAALGIDLATLQAGKAPLCRTCLDWSARRSHLAGSLGRAFLTRFEALGWARRVPETRIVSFSPMGTKAFEDLFGVA